MEVGEYVHWVVCLLLKPLIIILYVFVFVFSVKHLLSFQQDLPRAGASLFCGGVGALTALNGAFATENFGCDS